MLLPFWWLLGALFSRRSSQSETHRNILIFDFHLIGDIVLLTPLLKALREGNPDDRIVLVAGQWAHEILKGTFWVDAIIPFSAPWVKYGQGFRGWLECFRLVRSLRQKTWDLGIEVRGDVRQILLLALSGAKRRVGYDLTGGAPLLTEIIPVDNSLVHLADYNKRICEYLGVWPHEMDYIPILQLTEEEIAFTKQVSPYIGLHFGASLPLKRAPISLARDIVMNLLTRRPSCRIVLFNLPEDPDYIPRLLDMIGQEGCVNIEVWSGTLREFIVILSRCKHLIAMDSAAGHIGAALGRNVTAIFGPTESKLVKPLGNNVTIVEGLQLHCKPCNLRYCGEEQIQECMLGLNENIVNSINEMSLRIS